MSEDMAYGVYFIATLFCCLPFGIIGIINASKVSSLYAQGLVDEAKAASATAETWTKIAFWCGIVGSVSYFMLIFSGVLYS